MKSTLKTRKPVDQITPEDLAQFPIWEYAVNEESVEGQDETWVKPVKASSVPPGQYSLLVAALYRAACGREFCGFVTVSTDEKPPGISEGAILENGNYLFVPGRRAFNAKKDRADLAKRLDLTLKEMFPFQYELKVLIRGESALRKGKFT